MNNKRIAFTLLFILTVPFIADADSTTRIEITPTENYVAYPGDTVQQFVDVEYFGEEVTTLKVHCPTPKRSRGAERIASSQLHE